MDILHPKIVSIIKSKGWIFKTQSLLESKLHQSYHVLTLWNTIHISLSINYIINDLCVFHERLCYIHYNTEHLLFRFFFFYVLSITHETASIRHCRSNLGRPTFLWNLWLLVCTHCLIVLLKIVCIHMLFYRVCEVLLYK